MAALVQTKKGDVTSGTTLTIDITASGSGNLLLVAFNTYKTTVSSVVDSAGNTWTQDWYATHSSINAYGYHLPAASNTGGITSVTITIAASADLAASVDEWSGVTSTMDGIAPSGTGDAATASSGSLTTANANDLLWGAIGTDVETVSAVATGWTSEGTQTTNNVAITAAYQVVSATGSYTLSGTLSASGVYAADFVAFEAGSAPVVVTGSAAVTLNALSIAATGEIAGTADVALGAVSMAATGTVTVVGAGTVALGSLDITATGVVTVFGSSAVSLGNLDVTAAGAIQGSAALTLGALDITASGAIAVLGSAAVALGSLDITATGAIQGSAAVALGALDVVATGDVTALGTASVSLGVLDITAAGQSSEVVGSAAVTLGALSVVAAVHSPVQGAIVIGIPMMLGMSNAVHVNRLAAQRTLAFVAVGTPRVSAPPVEQLSIAAEETLPAPAIAETLPPTTPPESVRASMWRRLAARLHLRRASAPLDTGAERRL